MTPPGLGAVIFLTLFMVAVFSLGFFLVHRVMNRPGTHIGSRLPDPDELEEGPDTAVRPGAGDSCDGSQDATDSRDDDPSDERDA